MDTQTTLSQRRTRRWRRWVFGGLLGFGLLAFFVLAGALIAGGVIARGVWNSLERIEVDPDVVHAAVEQAVEITLREGDVQQRLELIATLEQMGPDARPFVPQLLDCAKDEDPMVREAATKALGAIDPGAAEGLPPDTS